MRGPGLIAGCVALATLSLLVVAPAPGYDPWSWLLWGREVAHGTLSTEEGPAFKPLPVALCAVLSPLGDDVAPVAWVVLARAGTIAAVGLGFVAGRRLAGAPAGVLAAAGVALCGSLALYGAVGDVTGLFLAFVLGGVLAWWHGREGIAVAAAVACCLLRVEAWPFALALGVVLWRPSRPSWLTSASKADGRISRAAGSGRRHIRPWLAGAVVAVPAAWFVPEWLGSGDLLRSGDRARVPNPGQPAEADIPALASLWDAVRLPLLPLLLAAVVAARRTPWLVAAGTAWILLVALMAQAGFSGEARYAVPGAALIAVAGAVAIARLPRPFLVAGVLLVAVAAVPRLVDLAGMRADQQHRWRLAQDLDAAIEAFGGREAVLRCGTAYVGPYRGPLMAHGLNVAKRDVEADARPRAPGVVFRSRLHRGSPLAPAASGFPALERTGAWQVHADCR